MVSHFVVRIFLISDSFVGYITKQITIDRYVCASYLFLSCKKWLASRCSFSSINETIFSFGTPPPDSLQTKELSLAGLVGGNRSFDKYLAIDEKVP